MGAKYANVSSVPLSIAVFLASDYYDYNDDPNTISATTLLKPLRQIILSSRVPQDEGMVDLEAMVQNRMGAAIHTAVERAWLTNYKAAMKDLGIPDRVIARVRINPDPETLKAEQAAGVEVIPVYLEQRGFRKVIVNGKEWNVSGQFDFVGDGRLEDVKSTSTFTAVNGTNDDKYIWQGSLYRWIHPTIITKDEMAIQWIFTDWSKLRAMQDPAYPQKRFQQKLFPLKSLQETQAFVERKLAQIMRYWDADEADIPECDDEDLWRSEPKFKYYASGDINAKRSTKNFDTEVEANTYMATQGKGAVKKVPGQVVACRYCPAFVACAQKDRLVASGDLTL